MEKINIKELKITKDGGLYIEYSINNGVSLYERFYFQENGNGEVYFS